MSRGDIRRDVWDTQQPKTYWCRSTFWRTLRYVDLFVVVWTQTVTRCISSYSHEELKMAPNSVGQTSQCGYKSGYEWSAQSISTSCLVDSRNWIAGLSIFVPLLMHAYLKTNACLYKCAPGKKRCLSFSIQGWNHRAWILTLSRMDVDPWKLRIIGNKNPHLPWPSYRRRKLYTHAAILTHDLKTQVALNIVHSEQEIQDEGHRESHNTFIQ